jgi:hypothetical protein
MVMLAIQVQPIVLLNSYDIKRSKIVSTLAKIFSAVEEGFNKAECYEALSRKSGGERAVPCRTREDLPRFVMFGKS